MVIRSKSRSVIQNVNNCYKPKNCQIFQLTQIATRTMRQSHSIRWKTSNYFVKTIVEGLQRFAEGISCQNFVKQCRRVLVKKPKLLCLALKIIEVFREKYSGRSPEKSRRNYTWKWSQKRRKIQIISWKRVFPWQISSSRDAKTNLPWK